MQKKLTTFLFLLFPLLIPQVVLLDALGLTQIKNILCMISFVLIFAISAYKFKNSCILYTIIVLFSFSPNLVKYGFSYEIISGLIQMIFIATVLKYISMEHKNMYRSIKPIVTKKIIRYILLVVILSPLISIVIQAVFGIHVINRFSTTERMMSVLPISFTSGSAIYHYSYFAFYRYSSIFDEPGTFATFAGFLTYLSYNMKSKIRYIGNNFIAVIQSTSLSLLGLSLSFLYYSRSFINTEIIKLKLEKRSLIIILLISLFIGLLILFRTDDAIVNYFSTRINTVLTGADNRSIKYNDFVSAASLIHGRDSSDTAIVTSGIIMLSTRFGALPFLTMLIIWCDSLTKIHTELKSNLSTLKFNLNDYISTLLFLLFIAYCVNDLFNINGIGLLLLAYYGTVAIFQMGDKNIWCNQRNE